MDHARKGDNALAASRNDEAIQAFTDAIAVNPTAVKYYISRSTAFQRSSRYSEALTDAEIAVVLAHNRGTRALVKDAQFRRALALFFLERYGDAEFVLGAVHELDAKDKMLPVWNIKVAAKLKDVAEDDERRKVTVPKLPNVDVANLAASAKRIKADTSTTAKPETGALPKTIVPVLASKTKLDWYQNNESVTINILAKGVPEDAADIEIQKDSLSISFPLGGASSNYSYSADPLYASIDPVRSKSRITPNKVEITLRKQTAGVKWHDLEGDREVQVATEDKSTIPSHLLTSKASRDSAPVYPTSSKSGAKDWDRLASDEIDDKDEIEGDETSHFFKKLYKDCSPEQQRAMMKSYQESAGTVLSTDWSNVGDKTIVPEPPDGMEAKKY